MSLVAAVGTDTYGGLSGFKRPVSGNPARVPTNLPAFRGNPNKPGSNIKAPAIKSSANHPDRKTNVCIPYARQVPLQVNADMGRVQAGDVIFVSRDRPGIPGYAHSRFTRLAGVDALNKWMGPNFWYMRTDDAKKFRYISVDNPRIADDWRNVPFLSEWTMDGIVLSNEEREVFHADGPTAASGQLFNIAIQGPCMMNNGFIDNMGSGQPARPSMLFAPGYMDHRVERIGQDKIEVDQQWDFQADYRGPQYHLYPMQMFDRNIRPMNELFCGLVAHFVTITTDDSLFLLAYVAAEDGLKKASKVAAERRKAGEPRVQWGQALDDAKDAWKDVKAKGGSKRFKKVTTALTAYRQMGWWDEENATTKESKINGLPPFNGFHYFQWVLFTSAHAWQLDQSIDIMAPAGEPPAAKRTKKDVMGNDPFDNFETRREHFTKMIGAWKIGKVLDMKSAKMPYYEGGPMETGYRVTTDVELEWWDWRKLRRAFTTNPAGTQFCEEYETTKFVEDVTAPEYNAVLAEHSRIFRWPTAYDVNAVEGSTFNTPINPQAFYDGKDEPKPVEPTVVENLANEAGFDPEFFSEIALESKMYGDSALVRAIRATRAKAMQKPPGPPSNGDDLEAHINRASVAMSVLKALHAPPSKEEIQAHARQMGIKEREQACASSIATFVQAAATSTSAMQVEPAAAPAAAPVPVASIVAPTAPVAAIRRRAGNTPEPSPDRSGSVVLSAPTAGAALEPPVGGPVNEGRAEPSGTSLQTVVEDAAGAEPLAPAVAKATAPRRSRGSAPQTDVFSSIFGGSETSAGLQPLNPAHRADAPGGAGGASTGRSFQRRKGKDKETQ